MIKKYSQKAINLLDKSKRFVHPSNEPYFLILGAQKAGTSSLHYYLEQHPHLSSGARKEIGYFHRDIYFGKSFQSYKRDFSGPREKLYFEATPEYLIHPDVPQNIHAKLPGAKLIVLLRDPIKRAYSAWNHYKQHFETGKYIKAIKNKPRRQGNLLYEKLYQGRIVFPSFRDCIEIELSLIEKGEGFEPAIFRRGLYLNQLENYWKFFSPEQVLIIGFKDLVEQTDTLLNQVCEFIGIDAIDWSLIDREPRNMREYKTPIFEDDKQFLEELYAEPNQELYERIGMINW